MILATAWTPEGTVLVIGALVTLVGAVGAAAAGVVVAWKANTKAGEAVAKAAEATGKADGAQLSVGRLSNRSNEQDRAISTLEMASPPPVVTPLAPAAVPAANPEQRKVAQSALQQIADGQRAMAEAQAATIELLRELATNTKTRKS